MKIKAFTLLLFTLMLVVPVSAQLNLFQTYPDSLSLAMDARAMTNDFIERVKSVKPRLAFNIRSVVHTTPNLTYYDNRGKMVVIPMWQQLITPQKEFFANMAGDYKEGIRMFGLFFNGFYIAHELGHALQFERGEPDWNNLYEIEYVANEIAISYWREAGWYEELYQCYRFAKLMVSVMPDPVPEGQSHVEFFSVNHANLGLDPHKYAYFQFRQFVTIYEDERLPGFEQYIREFFEK